VTAAEPATPRARSRFRVGFSIALFLLILFANRMGWIESTGVPITRNAPR